MISKPLSVISSGKTMRAGIVGLCVMMSLSSAGLAQEDAEAGTLKVHSIFSSNMVIQRGKPIKVWGWAQPGQAVSVQLGAEKAETKAGEEKGRWDVELAAREASSVPQGLTVTSGDEASSMTNIVVGDVWVMYGQSNMAWGLQKTTGSDIARLQANMPMLRHFRIKGNEQQTLQENIRPGAIVNGGWAGSTPPKLASHCKSTPIVIRPRRLCDTRAIC